MRPSRGILSGFLASAALVAAFGCAIAVVRPGGGEPSSFAASVTPGAHVADLRLPAERVVRSASALPTLRVVAAPSVAPRAAPPRRAVAIDGVTQERKTAVAPRLPTTVPFTASAPEAPAPASAPVPVTQRAAPTLTETAGAAITATTRSVGDAVTPVSPQAGDAVSDTGQAVGDAVAGVRP